MSTVSDNNPGSTGFLSPQIPAPPTLPVSTESDTGKTSSSGASPNRIQGTSPDVIDKSNEQLDIKLGAITGGTTSFSNNLDPENPTLQGPSQNLLVEINSQSPSKSSYNPMLGGICIGCLLDIMAAIMRMGAYLKKVESEKGIEAQSVESDAVHTIADAQERKGEIEMYSSFAQAFCCGLGVGVNLGVAAGHMRYGGPRTQQGAIIAASGQAMNGIAGQDSVASNIARGIGSYESALQDKTITLTQFVQRFSQQVQEKLEQDRKDVASMMDQVLQMVNKWVDSIYQFTARG